MDILLPGLRLITLSFFVPQLEFFQTNDEMPCDLVQFNNFLAHFNSFIQMDCNKIGKYALSEKRKFIFIFKNLNRSLSNYAIFLSKLFFTGWKLSFVDFEKIIKKLALSCSHI